MALEQLRQRRHGLRLVELQHQELVADQPLEGREAQVGGVLLAHLLQHGEAALVGGELGQPDVDHRADEGLARTALPHAGA